MVAESYALSFGDGDDNEHIDTPSLLKRAKENLFKCEIYPFDSSWHDIGNITVFEELNK